MKITAFNPLILTKNAADVIALLEELGFEHAHTKTGIEGHVTSEDMKHPGGFRVDVANTDALPQDMTAIRINVDNFEEAYEFLTSKGFKNAAGDKVTDAGSSKAALMISPSGYAINLVQHIKK